VSPGAKVTPDENGVGLEKALEGYAKWTQEFVYGCELLQPIKRPETDEDFCSGCTQFGYTSNTTLECFDTYNASNLFFADRTVGNGADRQWNWMLCNEVSYFRTSTRIRDLFQEQLFLWFEMQGIRESLGSFPIVHCIRLLIPPAAILLLAKRSSQGQPNPSF
jgi:hypothetical protein